jgi:hypothetical protein
MFGNYKILIFLKKLISYGRYTKIVFLPFFVPLKLLDIAVVGSHISGFPTTTEMALMAYETSHSVVYACLEKNN